MSGLWEADERRHRLVAQRSFRHARRSPKASDVLPVLDQRGLSTGDFEPTLRELPGEDASGLSPSLSSPLTERWRAESEAFQAPAGLQPQCCPSKGRPRSKRDTVSRPSRGA